MPSPGPSLGMMGRGDLRPVNQSIMSYLFSEVKVSFLHAPHGCGFANRCGAWMLSLFRDWIAPIPQCLDCGVGALYSGR